MSLVNGEGEPKLDTDHIRASSGIALTPPIGPRETTVTAHSALLSPLHTSSTHTAQNALNHSVSSASTSLVCISRPVSRANSEDVARLGSSSLATSPSVHQESGLTTTLQAYWARQNQSLQDRSGDTRPIANAQSRCVPLIRITFGTILQNFDGKPHFQHVSPWSSEYPCMLDDVETLYKMLMMQKCHFSETYAHYGLRLTDCIGAATLSFNPADGRYSDPRVSFDDADWNHEIEMIRTAHSERCSCFGGRRSPNCMQQTKVMLLFDQIVFNKALETKKINLADYGFVFLDDYNDTHGRKLLEDDLDSYFQYSDLCQKAAEIHLKPQNELYRKLAAAIEREESYVSTPENQSFSYQESSPPTSPSPTPPTTPTPVAVLQKSKTRRRTSSSKPIRAQAVVKPSPAISTEGLDSIRGPKGVRLFVSPGEARAPPARKYFKATEKPLSIAKGENDSCLTCIRHGRLCTGTKMVLFKGGLRCEQCARKQTGRSGGTRKCYWKNEAEGILTYEDAKEADQAKIVKIGNTRAAKREKARARLAQINSQEEQGTVSEHE